MGTLASFFVGNPSDVASREWLGCVAFDGDPDGDCGDAFKDCKSPNEFREAVWHLGEKRDDFCDPKKHSFPFPWVNDLYMTDYTYAFFDGRMRITCFHAGWRDLASAIDPNKSPWDEDAPDELPQTVPSPVNGDKPSGPDSIRVITARR